MAFLVVPVAPHDPANARVESRLRENDFLETETKY